MSQLGLIVGSGFAQAGFAVVDERRIETPYGATSAPLLTIEVAGRAVYCLARHGDSHSIAPHEINYRANIWALHSAGVRRVVSFNAVGSIAEGFAPGDLAVPDQLIDYTFGREASFGSAEGVVHLEFTEPFAAGLRRALSDSIEATAGRVHTGTYAVTQGPRLETAAEVDRLERDGCAMVGMTAMPEAALAAELGLEYAVIAFSVNRAAGRGPRGASLLAEIEQNMALGITRARQALTHWIGHANFSGM